MDARNGFFQLVMNSGSIYIRLFAPAGGGEAIRVNELKDYLLRKGYNKYNQVELNKALFTLDGQKDVLLDEREGYAERESLSVELAPDKMKAVVRFYPPSSEGDVLTYEEVISDLGYNKVIVGIDENVIKGFLQDRKYCTDYLVAKGIEPIQGSDAKIEYFFNTNPNVKPKMNEDGSVDFFDLQTISKCTEGQVLAVLTKENPGQAGQNVTGERVPQADVKKKMLKYGKNIELSEDGLTLTASVNGHVSLVDDKVFVSDVYEVNDVDTSTGNIEYAGNVLVRGNVQTGFSLKAGGDIEVKGVVEGAVLQAGGNIIITRGINGMNRGTLTAEGNIISKFIENATVNAGGFVHTEAILHSHVSAKGDIDVTGRKGFITGGTVCASNMISAKIIGSSMGTDTFIEVGVDPTIKERINVLIKNISDAKKVIASMQPVLTAMGQKIAAGEKLQYEQAQYVQKLVETCKAQQAQLKSDESELESIDGFMDKDTVAQVNVQSEVYPGTKITISDVSLYVKESYKHCKFVKRGGDVKMIGL
jgi:uncharacterized protein